ncbi:LysR family transcriptional regulator [Leucobacter viscericola]|uniref:LysR family transcriptional regulator n=1 Tax=Leucobacter viscericola TaxID=2714935 RepID=A0A6G7XET6_9MICO|nr:LysR family transcriptional regulator [Leucobacter viscericola]QIK62881.1 LysR family transcriptional regulator [Leucobacter viscericola]
MELRQLEILRELGALGSVTAVAESLLVTPSAVSQQLSALQREFRAPLTQRRGRTLTLTNAGLALTRAGVDVIDAMAAAKHAVEVFESDPAGSVSLCGFHSAAQALFGPLISELNSHDVAPAVRLADEDVAQDAFPPLAAHYDLVLAHRLAHSAPWPTDGLRVIPLVQEPLDVALPLGHPLASMASLTPHDIAGERWVTSREGFSPDDLVRAIAAVTDSSIDVVHRVNDYGSVASVIGAGGTIGMVPRYTVGSTYSGLVLRPLTGITATRSIDLLTRPENLHRNSVQAVVAGLRAAMSRLVEATQDQRA